jgi:hypothetical protein
LGACVVWQRQPGGWRWLGREVEDDAEGGPSWAQSKNMLEDLMGHTAEKPPGLAKRNTSSENEIPPLKMKYLL